eukprot:5099131-Pyramimonas_sp.AAC.1
MSNEYRLTGPDTRKPPASILSWCSKCFKAKQLLGQQLFSCWDLNLGGSRISEAVGNGICTKSFTTEPPQRASYWGTSSKWLGTFRGPQANPTPTPHDFRGGGWGPLRSRAPERSEPPPPPQNSWGVGAGFACEPPTFESRPSRAACRRAQCPAGRLPWRVWSAA